MLSPCMYFGSPLDFPYPKSSILYNMISGIIETLTHIRNNLTAENLEEYYINFHPEHAAQQTPSGKPPRLHRL